MERVDDLLTKNKQLTKNKHVVIIAYMNKGVLSIAAWPALERTPFFAPRPVPEAGGPDPRRRPGPAAGKHPARANFS